MPVCLFLARSPRLPSPTLPQKLLGAALAGAAGPPRATLGRGGASGILGGSFSRVDIGRAAGREGTADAAEDAGGAETPGGGTEIPAPGEGGGGNDSDSEDDGLDEADGEERLLRQKVAQEAAVNAEFLAELEAGGHKLPVRFGAELHLQHLASGLFVKVGVGTRAWDGALWTGPRFDRERAWEAGPCARVPVAQGRSEGRCSLPSEDWAVSPGAPFSSPGEPTSALLLPPQASEGCGWGALWAQ